VQGLGICRSQRVPDLIFLEKLKYCVCVCVCVSARARARVCKGSRDEGVLNRIASLHACAHRRRAAQMLCDNLALLDLVGVGKEGEGRQ